MTTVDEFDVRVDERPEGTVVRVEGELDMATAPRLEELLESVDSSSHVVIDLSECSFVDSSSVRLLVATARKVEAAGGRLALVATDPGILRVLEITAIDTVLPVHSTIDAAF